MEEVVEVQDQLALPTNYEKKMTPEIAQKVQGLKNSIDMHDKGKVIAYAREEQASISNFYDSIIKGVGTSEMGEAGQILTKVIGEINGFDSECANENKGFLGFLKKQKSKLQTMQTKYKSLSDNMDNVVKELNKKDLALVQVSNNFDVMYDENRKMYEYLTMAIFAGEQALVEEREKLEIMKKEAELSGDMMELQSVSDYNDDITRFDRRLHDLRMTRAISIQQAPQIRNIQKGADEVSESIKTTISTAVPLWKSQMAIALGMQTLKEGVNAVNAVKDATNRMLLANSQMNKQLTVQTAKAVERGVVDIETINTINNDLIEAFNSSNAIAKKAITDRAEEVKQLQANEVKLKEAIVNTTTLN